MTNSIDSNTQLVKLVARLLNITLTEVQVPQIVVSEDKTKQKPDVEGDRIRSKSLTGKFPVLETPQGSTLMETLTIVKFLAR